MAAIRKHRSLWQAQIRKKGYKPLTKSFKKKADALLWTKTIESEIDRGLFIDRSKAETTTLREAMERYVREILPSKASL